MEIEKQFRTGDLVTFAPREGETAEGMITRVWDKPASDPYVTIRTTGDAGRTFTRCQSVVTLRDREYAWELEPCGCWSGQHLGHCIHRPGA